MASKTGWFETVSKVVENVSKRTTHQIDSDNKSTPLENVDIPHKFHSLKLMAIAYESLKACRNDASAVGLKSIDRGRKPDLCNANGVDLSKAVTTVHKDFNAVVGFSKRIARLVTDGEQYKVNRLFQGYNELIRFSKRATRADSYLYRSYYGLIEFSKRLIMSGMAEKRNGNHSDTDWQSYTVGGIKRAYQSMPNVDTIGKALYSYSTFWMTEENAGHVLQKSYDAQSYILEHATILFKGAVALKDVDRQRYEIFFQDLRNYLNNSIFADLSMIADPTCLIKTIHALAQAHLNSTGEERMSYSTTSILLDATSMLLEMFGLKNAQTDQCMKWLKQCTHITGIDMLLAMLFIQLLSIIMHCYTRNGKTMDDLFNDIRWMIGMSYENGVQSKSKNWGQLK